MKYLIMMYGSQPTYEMLAGEAASEAAWSPRTSRRCTPSCRTGTRSWSTREVLAGYTIVETDGLERATEIAMRLANTPHPPGTDLGREWYVDVRPVLDSAADLDG